MSDVPEPTAEDMKLDLLDHLKNLGHTTKTDAVYRGWYSLGHHAASLRRAIHAERQLAAANERIAELQRRVDFETGLQNAVSAKLETLRALIVEKDAALEPFAAEVAHTHPYAPFAKLTPEDCRRAKAAWEKKETT